MAWAGRLAAQVGREVGRLDLEQVVGLAQEQSIAARQAKNTLDTRYWEWRIFQSDLRPQLLLEGNLPDFVRTFQEVIQPDGTVEFQSVTINNSGVNLGLRQQVAATGGTIFAGAAMQRFDDFDRKRTLYNGQPIAVGFIQPLFAFNPWKWDKKIEPLRYQESRQQFLVDREEIGLVTCGLFFDLLLAQVNLEMALFNEAGNDTIYKIALERSALGQLSRNDLLQLQLGVLNARKDAAAARQDLAAAQLRLQAFTGLRSESGLELELPEDIPAMELDEDRALEQAWLNRPETAGFQRRMLQAEREVARAKGETGLDARLSASFGLSNKATQFGDVFQRPQDQESVQLQFTVPIVDWGRASSRRQSAKANQALAEATVEQDRLDFEQEVRTQVTLFNMLSEQLDLSRQADAIGQERFQIAKDRFILGGLSITDLNLALQEKDRARRDYVAALRAFWSAYYQLRALTLYDFIKGQKIF
jgi:outer membrane protein